MPKNAAITLGPLLGLEDDFIYTVTLLTESYLEPSSLSLHAEYAGNVIKVSCSFEEKLATHFLYKFNFEAAKQVDTYPISYSIYHLNEVLSNRHQQSTWEFVVPGTAVIPKIGFASCNGNSKKLPDIESNNDYLMWQRLLESHQQDGLNYAFHCILLSGDQIYADPIWDEIGYFKQNKLLGRNCNDAIAKHRIDDKDKLVLKQEIEAFYENLYINSWNNLYTNQVMACIPSIMMWDDHDIFDGWGSHPEALQRSEIFQLIFSVAKKYFELLQIRGQQNLSLINAKAYYSMRLSLRNYEVITLDNRSFRTKQQIMSDQQYLDLDNIKKEALFSHTSKPLSEEKVLLFVIPVPVAHLDYKKRAEKWLRRFFSNNFRSSLNDDGLDHWDHEKHKTEQKRLIDMMFDFGEIFAPKYIHIISGDVHSAGAAKISSNGKHINQLIASPIVYKPVGKLTQWFLNLVTNKESRIDNYEIKLKKFGSDGRKVIYERNFCFLYKAEKAGLKAYMTVESNNSDYQFDQSAKFKDSSST